MFYIYQPQWFAFSSPQCVPSGEARTWKNGDYKVGEINSAIVHVDDDAATLTYLKFQDSESGVDHSMCWVAKGNNSVMISLHGETFEAKVSSDKLRISGGPPALLADSVLTWITPEEALVIRNRPKQSVAAPKVPYPLKPGQPGKLAIITGPPGSGKSTIAGIIAKKEGWIFYEGDGFLFGFNPYVFPNESQVDARSDKPALVGPGMSARGAALTGYVNSAWSTKQTTDRSPTNRFFRLMAEDIKKERARVGGDWVVAYAMAKRSDRDIFREVLGEDLVFVVLDISLELVKERLSGRGEGEESFARIHHKYEPAQRDEPKTVEFEILKEATREENAQGVFELINKQSAIH